MFVVYLSSYKISIVSLVINIFPLTYVHISPRIVSYFYFKQYNFYYSFNEEWINKLNGLKWYSLVFKKKQFFF